MTQEQFYIVCIDHCIDPGVALESEAVVQALKDGVNADQLSNVLAEEF